MGFFPIYFKVLASSSTVSKNSIPPFTPNNFAITKEITRVYV